jgi:hypothetical protein
MRLSPTTRSFFVVALLLISVRALAVDIDALKDTTPKERAEAQTLMMKENLGLSEAKTEKVRAINLKYADKMEPVIEGSDGPMMKGREARNFQAQKEGELKAVLSADEYKKYLASKKEMRQHIVERVYEERAKSGH